jgi:hypothetical protein
VAGSDNKFVTEIMTFHDTLYVHHASTCHPIFLFRTLKRVTNMAAQNGLPFIRDLVGSNLGLRHQLSRQRSFVVFLCSSNLLPKYTSIKPRLLPSKSFQSIIHLESYNSSLCNLDTDRGSQHNSQRNVGVMVTYEVMARLSCCH